MESERYVSVEKERGRERKEGRVLREGSDGYGFSFLPTQPGEHELEVNIWRPNGSAKEEYLGGHGEMVAEGNWFC